MHTNTVWRCILLLGQASLLRPHLALFENVAQNDLNGLIARERMPDGTIGYYIALPPWQKSRTFGPPHSFVYVCEPLCLLSETLITHLDPNARVQERREWHMSWP